jgi:ABC-type bacteriocin/lantibiotic exporter with double-glycine peptidase domain
MAATAARDLSSLSSVIQLKGVNKWFGQFHVLTDINLDVKEGEKIVICGPSGSGKSTLDPLHQSPGGASARAISSCNGVAPLQRT